MKVPWIPKKAIEEKTADMLYAFEEMSGRPVRPPIPVEDIIEQFLGLNLVFDNLAEKLGMEDVLGATYVKERLICVHENLLEKKTEGRLVFTCAHEVAHWVMHRPYVKVAERSNRRKRVIICRAVNAKQPIEWQADYFAACLLMPERELRKAFYGVVGKESLQLYNVKSSFRGNALFFDSSVENWPLIADAVRRAGNFTNVSLQALMIRMQELGLLINLTGTQMTWDQRTRIN